MASKSYTLLEYLVSLENKLKELKKYVENNSSNTDGNTGVNVDLSGIQNQINELEDKINDLESNFIKNEDTNSSIEVE